MSGAAHKCVAMCFETVQHSRPLSGEPSYELGVSQKFTVTADVYKQLQVVPDNDVGLKKAVGMAMSALFE